MVIVHIQTKPLPTTMFGSSTNEDRPKKCKQSPIFSENLHTSLIRVQVQYVYVICQHSNSILTYREQ